MITKKISLKNIFKIIKKLNIYKKKKLFSKKKNLKNQKIKL